METKPLLYGLIGFFIGGFIVSVAATNVDKPYETNNSSMTTGIPTTMDHMTDVLRNKTGDDFDKAFINSMIIHHEGAVEMAKLSEARAKHSEIKVLSKAIITAQETEITQMKKWQKDWGYSTAPDHDRTRH